MLDTVHQMIQPWPTHTKAGVLVIQKNNLYLCPPRSTSNSSDFFSEIVYYIEKKYAVTNFRKQIRTITGGPWWTQIKVVLIQKGLLDN